jgi:hypothetical protein
MLADCNILGPIRVTGQKPYHASRSLCQAEEGAVLLVSKSRSRLYVTVCLNLSPFFPPPLRT